MRSSKGLTAVGIFLVFAFIMASLAGITLLWPGTPFDRMWALNPLAYKRLAPFAVTAGVSFLVLGAALMIAGVGWLKRHAWGWWLAFAIITAQALGDLLNLFKGDFFRGGVGLTIASALLFYLLRPRIRAAFVMGNRRNP